MTLLNTMWKSKHAHCVVLICHSIPYPTMFHCLTYSKSGTGCSRLWPTIDEEWGGWTRRSCATIDSRFLSPKRANRHWASIGGSASHNRLCSVTNHEPTCSIPFSSHIYTTTFNSGFNCTVQVRIMVDPEYCYKCSHCPEQLESPQRVVPHLSHTTIQRLGEVHWRVKE